MRRTVTIMVAFFCCLQSFAGHIAGGELFYEYLGPGTAPNSDKYKITLRLFRECHPAGTAAPLPGEVFIGVFKNTVPAILMQTIDVKRTTYQEIQLQKALTCIINPPEICYQVGTYSFEIDLVQDSSGYTLSYQTCCRSNSIVNVEFFAIPGGQGPGEG